MFIKREKNLFFFILGIACFLLVLMIPTTKHFNHQIIYTIAVTLLMLIWWISEALPIAMTSLMPICLFPILGIMDVNEVTQYYSNKIIYLMLSGFLLGVALQKWKLNYRIALNILSIVGNHPAGVILGFMISTALLSMWVSNTATTIIMTPVAISFLNIIKKDIGNFASILMLSIAYSASIGGIGSIIGTPTNAVLVAHISSAYNIDISFGKWLILFLPLVSILILVMWIYLGFIKLKKVSLSGISGANFAKNKLNQLGNMKYEEKAVTIIFSLLAFLWIIKGYLPATISDGAIGIACCSLFFIIRAKTHEPSNTENKNDYLLNWSDTKNLPWGILILFGGGMALAKGLEKSGVVELITVFFHHLGIKNILLITMFFTIIVISFTEMMSNMALITVFAPVLSTISIALTGSPFTLTIPATLAASCAFMLPMATPPNAIILSSGYITIKNMVKVGLLANLIAVIIIETVHFCVSIRT